MDVITFHQLKSLTENQARELVESIRWHDGIVCPKCGSDKGAYALQGKAHRNGVYKCIACREQFTVTVGTIFQGSHIKIVDWLIVIYFMSTSKKGISTHQIHQALGVTYKTAWFMCHRIRYAMTQEPLFSKLSGEEEVGEPYTSGEE